MAASLPRQTDTTTRSERRRDHLWSLVAIGAVLALALAIRFGTRASSDEPRFDETYSHPAISGIVRQGWSVATAIDFQETKGPGFIWPYAAAGGMLGDSLPSLRWVSIIAFVLGAVPLTALARRAGVRGPGLLAVALLYALLPQQALLGQLVMSEALFVTLSLCCVWAFWWGLEGRLPRDGGPAISSIDGRWRRPLALVAVFLLLAILAHARVHVAALGLAMIVVAWQRDGVRSWPWLVAVVLAGLTRIPLAIRWGGLVSPAFREQHHLGHGAIQWSNVVYLLAALLPLTGVFLVLCWRRGNLASPTTWPGRVRSAGPPGVVALTGLAGAALGALAAPSRATLLPPTPGLLERAPQGLDRYLGPTASMWRGVESALGSPIGRPMGVLLVSLLAGLGAASIAELARRSWSPMRADQSWSTDARLLGRLTVISILAGMGMYALAQSLVVDRYLVPWAMLLPVLWWMWLPRWATLAWGALLAVGAAVWLGRWLG